MTDLEVRGKQVRGKQVRGKQVRGKQVRDSGVRGRYVPAPVQVSWSWWRARGRRGDLHTRPLVRPVAGGRHRLPGMAVDTLLQEAPDPYRRPVGLVLAPATGHVSLTLGAARRSVDTRWTTDLGAWLARLSGPSQPELGAGLVGCAVVIRRRADHLQVLVQPTWRTTGPEGRTDPPALAVEACARVPCLVLSLAHARVGTMRPLTAGQLVAVVYDAYQPTGRPPGDDRPWARAGQAGHVERWDALVHAGARSRTLAMSRVPPEAVLSSVAPLLAAVPPELARVQVTICWSPDAPHAPDARGAGAVRALVTVTAAARQDRLDDATGAMLAALPAASRPWLRPLYGSQAAGFAAGLPGGVLLDVHSARPALFTGTE